MQIKVHRPAVVPQSSRTAPLDRLSASRADPSSSCRCARGWVQIKSVLIHSDGRTTASRMGDEESDRHDDKRLGGFISSLYLLQPVFPARRPRA